MLVDGRTRCVLVVVVVLVLVRRPLSRPTLPSSDRQVGSGSQVRWRTENQSSSWAMVYDCL
jgi:hypothetical protein